MREISFIQSISSVDQRLIGQNQDYLALRLNFAVNAMEFAATISIFPKHLKPYIAISSGCHDSASLGRSQD